jgi:hypothetical protein
MVGLSNSLAPTYVYQHAPLEKSYLLTERNASNAHLHVSNAQACQQIAPNAQQLLELSTF